MNSKYRPYTNLSFFVLSLFLVLSPAPGEVTSLGGILVSTSIDKNQYSPGQNIYPNVVVGATACSNWELNNQYYAAGVYYTWKPYSGAAPSSQYECRLRKSCSESPRSSPYTSGSYSATFDFRSIVEPNRRGSQSHPYTVGSACTCSPWVDNGNCPGGKLQVRSCVNNCDVESRCNPVATPTCSCNWADYGCNGYCPNQRQYIYLCNYATCPNHGAITCSDDPVCNPPDCSTYSWSNTGICGGTSEYVCGPTESLYVKSYTNPSCPGHLTTYKCEPDQNCCTCSWIDGDCGGSCPDDQLEQEYICNSLSCPDNGKTRCVPDSTCEEPECVCFPWYTYCPTDGGSCPEITRTRACIMGGNFFTGYYTDDCKRETQCLPDITCDCCTAWDKYQYDIGDDGEMNLYVGDGVEFGDRYITCGQDDACPYGYRIETRECASDSCDELRCIRDPLCDERCSIKDISYPNSLGVINYPLLIGDSVDVRIGADNLPHGEYTFTTNMGDGSQEACTIDGPTSYYSTVCEVYDVPNVDCDGFCDFDHTYDLESVVDKIAENRWQLFDFISTGYVPVSITPPMSSIPGPQKKILTASVPINSSATSTNLNEGSVHCGSGVQIAFPPQCQISIDSEPIVGKNITITLDGQFLIRYDTYCGDPYKCPEIPLETFDSRTFEVYFGDGEKGNCMMDYDGSYAIQASCSIAHNYSSEGTYQITAAIPMAGDKSIAGGYYSPTTYECCVRYNLSEPKCSTQVTIEPPSKGCTIKLPPNPKLNQELGIEIEAFGLGGGGHDFLVTTGDGDSKQCTISGDEGSCMIQHSYAVGGEYVIDASSGPLSCPSKNLAFEHCSDGIDNDYDTLIDCKDPDCCPDADCISLYASNSIAEDGSNPAGADYANCCGDAYNTDDDMFIDDSDDPDCTGVAYYDGEFVGATYISDTLSYNFAVSFRDKSVAATSPVDWTFSLDQSSVSGQCLQKDFSEDGNTIPIDIGQLESSLADLSIVTVTGSYCTVDLVAETHGKKVVGTYSLVANDLGPICPNCEVTEIPAVIHPISVYSLKRADASEKYIQTEMVLNNLTARCISGCSNKVQAKITNAKTNLLAAEMYLQDCQDGRTACRLSQYYSTQARSAIDDAYSLM